MEQIRDGEIHPLENSVILRLIFERCKFDELKICRLVSKSWRDISLKRWRTSAVLKIGFCPWNSFGVSIPELLDFVRNEDNKYFETPYTSFLLYEQSEELWNLCGSTIKCLHIRRGAEFRSVVAFRDAIYRRCSNLEQLLLSDTTFFGGADRSVVVEEPSEWQAPPFGENWNLKSIKFQSLRGAWKISWMEFLSHYPSLEEISLTDHIPNSYKLFESLSIIRKRDRCKLKLKHLDTSDMHNFNNSKGLINILRDPDLNLESLSISSTCISLETGTLAHILSNHSSSLKKCFISGIQKMHLHPYDRLPYSLQKSFDNLQELSLTCQVFSSMSILKFTPKLKKLMLTRGCLEAIRGTVLSEDESICLKDCKELNMFWEVLEAEDYKILLDWMPNLECLEATLNNETFAAICEKCPNLKSLNVTGVGINDCGITGFDAEDVIRINKEEEERRSSSCRPITVRRANVTSLKYLEYFSLNGFGVSPRPELNHCAAVYGFQQMAKLKHLRIKNSALRPLGIWFSLFDEYPWKEYRPI